MSTVYPLRTQEEVDRAIRSMLNRRVIWYCLECDAYLLATDKSCAICGAPRQWSA